MINTTKTMRWLTVSALLTACGQGENLDGGWMGGPVGGVADDDRDQFDDEDEVEDEEDTEGEEEPAEDHSDAQDDFVLGLETLELPSEEPPHEEACDPEAGFCSEPWDEGDFTCWYAQFSETENSDGVIALQPNSAGLWPGSIVRLAEAYEGDLVPISVPRDPMTFSLSLESLNGTPSRTMDEPSLSSFRELRNEILSSGVTGATAAQIEFSVVTISSASQLELHVGAEVEWSGGAALDAMFNFEDSEFSNRYLFDFSQAYYTADVDPPSRPSAMIADDVSVDELEAQMSDDNPPAYIQSVTYGRRVLFGIESNRSIEEMSAAINAAIANAEGGLDVTAQDTLAASKISAVVLGGNGELAVQTVAGPEYLMEYLQQGGNFSAESPGVPIAYKLAYLDNAPAKFSFTAQYAKKVCE